MAALCARRAATFLAANGAGVGNIGGNTAARKTFRKPPAIRLITFHSGIPKRILGSRCMFAFPG
jgi:hypothetical protein